MQVPLSKMGSVLRPRLPSESAMEIVAADGQRVEIGAEDSRVIIEPARERYTWAQMLENMTPEAVRNAFDRGDDLGPAQP